MGVIYRLRRNCYFCYFATVLLWGSFFDEFFWWIFWQSFWQSFWHIFWWFFLSNFFDEFFWRIFWQIYLMNFLTNFWRIILMNFLTYNLLPLQALGSEYLQSCFLLRDPSPGRRNLGRRIPHFIFSGFLKIFPRGMRMRNLWGFPGL